MPELKQYVQFDIGGESFAIQLAEIHEIIRMQELTEIPGSPPYVKGVINLRGKIIPIVSLRSLFMMDPGAVSKATRIIVVHHREEAIGIIVDGVHKVTTFEDVQPPPDRAGAVHRTYVSGIGIHSAGLTGILQLDEVLLRE